MQKGQAAIELLVILAISMAVLIAIYSYASTSMAGVNKQQLEDQAKTSVNTLASSANDVYRQGVGAKKLVFYSIPSGIDESLSGIEENTFVLNVLGSDIFAKPDVCLQGSFPTSSGGHWVWMTALEECVFIGQEKIAVDKTSSYVTMSQSYSEEDTITVTNNGEETATVFLSKSWPHSDVNLTLSASTFSLWAGASQEVTLTYSSSSSATGNYPGSLGIGANLASGDENISLPLNAEITVLVTDLILFPGTYSVTLRENDVHTADLNVCNNSGSTMTSISFSDSGEIASWIADMDSIASLDGSTCTDSSFTITVPSGQSPGDFTGTITGTDASANIDSTEVTVTIPAMSADFNFNWATAQFTANGERLWNWTTKNVGSDAITVDKMSVTWENDLDSGTLSEIRLNNSLVWSGSAASGQLLDITDFTMLAGATHTANNRLEFSKRMNDDGETFEIAFEFTDGSTYTTAVYST